MLLAVLEVIDMYLIMCYICECLKCVTNRITAFLLYYANDNKEIQSLVLIWQKSITFIMIVCPTTNHKRFQIGRWKELPLWYLKSDVTDKRPILTHPTFLYFQRWLISCRVATVLLWQLTESQVGRGVWFLQCEYFYLVCVRGLISYFTSSWTPL